MAGVYIPGIELIPADEPEYIDPPAIVSHSNGYVTLEHYGNERWAPIARDGDYVTFVQDNGNPGQIFGFGGGALMWRGDTVEDQAKNLAEDLGDAIYRAPSP